jgi:hypothetical protein
MQDIALFQLVRPPRRPDLSDNQKLLLTGDLIDQLNGFFKKGDTLDFAEVQNALTTFETSNFNPLDYALGNAQSDGAPVQDIAVLLGQLEVWLADHYDRPDGGELFDEIQHIKGLYANAAATWPQALTQFATLLASWLALWAARGKPQPIATGTRFALVADLARLDDTTRAAMAGVQPEETWDLLNRRVVLFPPALAACLAKARVPLVRQASVADLQVVRSEWRGYVPGEIATIRNVMAGESFEQTDKQVNETESTQTLDTQTMTQTQTDVQQTDESDLSRQVNTQLQVAVQGYLNTNYQQMGPGYNFSVSGGVSGGVQIGRSESLATKITRQAVSRAVATVQSQTHEIRSQRTLIRTEQSMDHKFDSMDTNRRGVYRWVDRIDRFQVFTYPHRLQLEFEIPEPAEYYRWRTASLQQQANVEAPPAWDPAVVDNIRLDDLSGTLKLTAVKYRAANLPVLPDKEVSVVMSATLKPEDMFQNATDSQWNAPIIVKDVEIAIPDGYVATSVVYSGYATPLRANWHYEAIGHPGGDNNGFCFHSISANVMVAGSNLVYLNFGDGNSSIQSPFGKAGTADVQFGQAGLEILQDLRTGAPAVINVDPGATQKMTVGIRAVGAGTLSVTFEVKCKRSSQTEDAWKSAVYDALYSAWSDWNKAWQSAQQNRALTGSLPVGESTLDRNEQAVRSELKRQVIGWLLNESPFQGRNSLLPPGGPPPVPPALWRDMDILAALASAPIIQFLEQAFEWANLTFVFYPYYWADRQSWDAINGVTAIDSSFESFLKAGSARVVVPARPGMESAVHHWLLYQEPFLGRPMPIPGDPMYVSVATEIRDLLVPPEDGIPGESWEAQIGTTFLWLDDSGAPLPTNLLAQLGAPPNEPKHTLFPPPAAP